MDNSSVLSMFVIIFIICITTVGLAVSDIVFDPRWMTAAGALVSAVCLVYISSWIWSIDQSLKLTNRLLVDQDEVLRPELKGAIQLLRQTLRGLWKWGLPGR